MACAWVDVCKTYDSIDYKMLLLVLQMHKIPVTLINAIIKVVKETSTGCRHQDRKGNFKPNPAEESLAPGRQPLSKTIYHLLEPPCMEDKKIRVHIKQANPT